MLFFDCVVCREVRAELDSRADELLEGEVGWALVGYAGIVEESPGLAEVVVLQETPTVSQCLPCNFPSTKSDLTNH